MKTMTIEIPLTDHTNEAIQLSWIVRLFYGSVADAYLKGSPRRLEAMNVAKYMVTSACDKGTITSLSAVQILNELDIIENQD